MKKRMTLLLAALLALLCACGGNNADGPSLLDPDTWPTASEGVLPWEQPEPSEAVDPTGEPGLEGVWVCGSGLYIRPKQQVTLTVDANGWGTIPGISYEFPPEASLRLCSTAAEARAVGWIDSDGNYSVIMDTTGNYLFHCGFVFVRADPLPHGVPDSRVTGTWEILGSSTQGTCTFSADGRYNVVIGERNGQGLYIILPGGAGQNDMLLLLHGGIWETRGSAYQEAYVYEIVEIDGVEHLRLYRGGLVEEADFTEPELGLARISEDSGPSDALIHIGGTGYEMSLSITVPGLPEEIWNEADARVNCGTFSVTISDGTRSCRVGINLLDQELPTGLCAVPTGPACSKLVVQQQVDGDYSDPLNVAVTATRTGETLTWSFTMPESGFPVEDIQEVGYFWYYRTSLEDTTLRGQRGTYTAGTGGLALTDCRSIEITP